MHEATDAADPLAKEDVLAKGIKLSGFLNPSVHIANDRYYPHHPLILTLKLELDWFREYRMLWTKRHYCARHLLSSI
jgi:hypothetical protein